MYDPIIPRDLDLELTLIAALHEEAEALTSRHEAPAGHTRPRT